MDQGTPLPPILVVDDEPDDVLLFQRAAARVALANPVEVATGGEEAVAWLSTLIRTPGRAMPIVMLLDLKMPRMSGFEVIEWVRHQPELHRLPIAVFTSSNQDPDIARAYDLGANSYLVKPVTFANLVEVVRAVGLYWAIHNRPPKLEANP